MAKWSEMPVISKLGIVVGAAIVATPPAISWCSVI